MPVITAMQVITAMPAIAAIAVIRVIAPMEHTPLTPILILSIIIITWLAGKRELA